MTRNGDQPEPAYLKTSDLCTLLQVSHTTVMAAVRQGQLRATRPPGTSVVRYAREDVERWLEAGRQ